jgi:purine/pyrimidine-nucleoside phosphorylase
MDAERFENVIVVKKANVYFDGKVTSGNVLFADGTRKTLGFMMPGDYTFNTGAREVMEVLGGEMIVLMPGNTDWHTYKPGDTFEVPANSSFKLKISIPADYCCSYG